MSTGYREGRSSSSTSGTRSACTRKEAQVMNIKRMADRGWFVFFTRKMLTRKEIQYIRDDLYCLLRGMYPNV